MRDIKFRVWDKQNKEMIHQQSYDLDNLYIGVIDGRLYVDNECSGMVRADNERFELMQFTGLYDRSGREIWEGDYIQWEDYRGLVMFGLSEDNKFPGFYVKLEEVQEGSDRYQTYRHDKNYKLIQRFPGGVRIIGNRFQSPELFGG